MSALNCSNCKQEINTYETYIEFDDSFYHAKCYKCQYCCVQFTTDNNQNDSNIDMTCLIPLKDKNNRLFCIKDVIRTLKCHLCCLTFEQNSQIYKLNNSTTDEDQLAHIDCVKCSSCELKINLATEYSIEDKSSEKCSIYCKQCSIKKDNKQEQIKSMKSKNRLSSRQKEILEAKYLQFNFDHLTEDNPLVCNLAKEVGCTRKSLIDFIAKRQDKLNELSILNRVNLAKDNILKNEALDQMLDELKKIDRVLAPNQSPFTQTAHKNVLLKV